MKPCCVSETKQQVLPFDFWDKEKQLRQQRYKEQLEELPYYENPKNEQECLFNLQREYFLHDKDKNILSKIFVILFELSKKTCVQTSKKYGFKCSSIRLEEISLDASTIIIEQIQKNDLMIRKSFLAYIRLQVLKTMFSQTLAQKLEKYCRQNKINLFELSDIERQKVKETFEKEQEEEKEEMDEGISY